MPVSSPGPFVAALVLALVYVLGDRLHSGGHATGRRWRRPWVSAASGAALAYVFVDVLPELATRHRAFVEAAGRELLFAEQRIYVVALLGFVVFYGLEHMVLTSRARGRREGTGSDGPVCWLHIGGFAAYSWLIGYLVVERAGAGRLALLLYTAAMAFHFLVVGHSLGEEHGRAYEGVGRWVLGASVLAGWLVGAITPVSEPLLARLFAFLAGGVVLTSLRAELPREGEGRFWPFGLGAGAYALLLMVAA